MKVISLKKVVEEMDIVKVTVRSEDGKELSFDIPSEEYETYKNYLIKGDFEVSEDFLVAGKELECSRLEKDLNISINRPTIVAEDAIPEDEAKLEEFVNMPVTVVVFHRDTLLSSSRETKRRFVTAYTEACIDGYQRTNPEAKFEDFALFEVDFANKSISLKSIPEKVSEKDEESTGD